MIPLNYNFIKYKSRFISWKKNDFYCWRDWYLIKPEIIGKYSKKANFNNNNNFDNNLNKELKIEVEFQDREYCKTMKSKKASWTYKKYWKKSNFGSDQKFKSTPKHFLWWWWCWWWLTMLRSFNKLKWIDLTKDIK